MKIFGLVTLSWRINLRFDAFENYQFRNLHISLILKLF
jgi:hypothetical protein